MFKICDSFMISFGMFCFGFSQELSTADLGSSLIRFFVGRKESPAAERVRDGLQNRKGML